MLAGYLIGVIAMSPVPLAYYWMFAPAGALAVTVIFAVAAIWSPTYANLARGALAAALFGITAVTTFIIAVAYT